MKINTEYGEGKLIDIYQSELGYIMIKLFFEESKKYITFNLGKNKLEILKDKNNENYHYLRYSQ